MFSFYWEFKPLNFKLRIQCVKNFCVVFICIDVSLRVGRFLFELV